MLTRLAGTLSGHWLFAAILVCVLVTAILALFVFRLQMRAAWDLMRLMAIARSMGNLTVPLMGGSHLMTSTDPHFSPYLLLVSAVWRSIGGSPQALSTAFSLFGVVGAAMLVTSLYKLCLLLTGRPQRAATCVAAALFMWGPAHTYWAGDYSIVGMMYASMYPQTYAYALACLCLVCYLRYMTTRRRIYLAFLAPLFFFVTLCHALTSAFVILGMICLAALRLHDQVPVALTLVVSGAATILWPYSSTFSAFGEALPPGAMGIPALLGGLTFLLCATLAARWAWRRRDSLERWTNKYRLWQIAAIMYSLWLTRIAFARGLGTFAKPTDKRILGPSGLGGILGARKITPLNFHLLGWAGCSLAVYYGGKLLWKFDASLPLWHRFVFFSMLPMHLLLGLAIYDGIVSIARPRALAASAALLVGSAVLLNVFAIQTIASRNSFLTPEIQSVADSLDAGSIVIADGHTSDILAGYFGFKTVAPILTEELGSERTRDVRAFLKLSTPAETLLAIRSRYSANVLVLHLPDSPGTMDDRIDDPLELERKYDGMFVKMGENALFAVYSLTSP